MMKLLDILSNILSSSSETVGSARRRTPEDICGGEVQIANLQDADNLQDAEDEPAQCSAAPATNVLFTRRAWTALMSEVFKEVLTETGGILLGYRRGSEWVVVESIDPGPDSIFEVAYFEYDQPYVTHQVNRVRNYYDPPLDLLGLWHRHPGSFDKFSGTDDETNRSYASMGPVGAISGLVNVDPHCRFTLYRAEMSRFGSMRYTRIPYSCLNAVDSERIAPLRDVDELAAAIERCQAFGCASAEDASPALLQDCADLPHVAQRVGYALARWQDGQNARAFDAAELMEWTDEHIAGLLETLGSDTVFFGKNGMELRMKLLDERYIELSARFEGQEEPLCALGLVPASSDGDAAACIVGGGSGSALPYESGLFRRCLSS